jgi:hypothetical protein
VLPIVRVAAATTRTKRSELMLGKNSYEQHYVDECRCKVEAQLEAYHALVAVARKGSGSGARVGETIEAFDRAFFNNLVLVLDAMFVHRLRAQEGKDGNPLNEVRMLCTSILQHAGVLTADSTIKYKSESSVLKYQIGEQISLDDAAFSRLAEAYFDEIEARFVSA